MPKLSVDDSLFTRLTLANRLPDLLPALEAPVERAPTGWALLDRALAEPGLPTGGFVVPSLVVLGAEPKCGKSIWAQHVAQAWVQRGGYVLYWDLENGAVRFARRLGWRLAKIASRELTQGLNKDEKARRDKMVRWFKKAGQRFAYQAERRCTPEDVRQWMSSACVAADGEPVLLVVDSLQKLPPLDKQDRRGSIDVWLRALEEVREDYHCVVLVVSELRRAQKDKYIPTGAAFKESGDIEYTCDLAMTFLAEGQRDAWLDIWWDRDGSTEARRVAKYTRVLPYYEIVETAPKKKERCPE